jgi:ubiquinol-cytochrome c reductase iron-sulfur subunit
MMATKAGSAEVSETAGTTGGEDGVRRRDFLNVAAVSFAGVGAVVAVAPLLVQMAPSADVLAQSTTEVDI